MGETSTRGGGRWPTAGEALLAALAALVILALGLGGAQRARELTLERREVEDRKVLADVTAGIGAHLQAELNALGSSTAALAVPGVGFLLADGSPASELSGSVAEALAHPSADLVLARARDSGQAELGAPVSTSVGPMHLMVSAVYAESGPGPLLGSTARRAQLRGFRVATLDLAAALRDLVPTGKVAALRDGSVALPGVGVSDDDLPEQVLSTEGRRLVVRAGDPDRVAITPPTIALALAGVVVGVAAAAFVLAAMRRRRHDQDRLERTASQVLLIGEVAPLVQQSLDLADVLPAVAVQLVDHFGLAGVRLSAGAGRAKQIELFSLGATPLQRKPVLSPPPHLDSGESLSLALQRAGRSVALLQVVAGRSLDDADLQSLRAITELITAAVVNASLYASQQEAVRRLRDLDGLKTVFLSTASHELRTPATAIGGFASLLETSWDRFDDAQRREFAARIAANARSLGAVVQDLLDFSLLDRGRLRLAITSLDLGALVQSVVDRLGPALPDHDVVCHVGDVPLVAGDENGIDRITTNLLTNAAKFSPSGSVITVEVVPDGDGAALMVSDEGGGVPPDERDQIFTRFYRGSGEAVVKTRGVGIGLSVVADLAERMGGDVSIDDAASGGACFTVRLPAASSIPTIEEPHDASTA